MATQYLSKTGLTYLWGRITALYQPKEAGKGLSTNDLTNELKAQIEKVSGIETQVENLVNEGGEPNVIETVKLNGVALTPDADKAVNVTAPVQSVKVNGTALTPDANGAVDVAVPRVSGSTTLSESFVAMTHANGQVDEISFNYTANGLMVTGNHDHGGGDSAEYTRTLPDETRVQALITAAVGNITSFRYQNVASLPATGEEGIIYLVPNSGSSPNIKDEYIWVNTGTTESPAYVFEKIGTTEMDLSGYLQTTDVEAITTAEIDEITGAATP